MLHYGKALTRSRLYSSVGSRYLRSFHVSLQRSQIVQASEVNGLTEETPIKNAEEKDNEESKEQFIQRKRDEFKASAESLVGSFQESLQDNTSSKDLLEAVFNDIEDLQGIQFNRLTARTTFSKLVNGLVRKSIKEIHDPLQRTIPPTPQDILNKAIYYEIADPSTFELVASDLFKNGLTQDVLTLWVTYLEYSVSQRIKRQVNLFKNITVLSFLESTAGTKPEVDTIKQLLLVDQLPSSFDLNKVLKSSIPKESIRYEPLSNALDALFYASKDPNSFGLIKNAIYASRKGESYKIPRILKDIRKISDVTGVKVSEETLVAFMKIFNSSSRFTETFSLWNEIIKSGSRPSTTAWNELLYAAGNSGPYKERASRLEGILQKIPEKNVETLVRLLNVYSKLNLKSKVEELATEENLKNPKFKTAYVNSLVELNELDRAKSLIGSDSISTESYNKFLSFYVKKKMFTEAKNLLNEMESNRIKPDIATFTIILDLTFKTARRAGKLPSPETTNDFFVEMKKANIEPNLFTYVSILDALGNEAASIDTAKFLFEHLKSKGLVNNVLYVSLISNEFNAGRVADAEAHFQEFLATGQNITSAHWALLFKGFQRNKKADKALQYLEALQKVPNFEKLLNKYSYYYILLLAKDTENADLAEKVFKVIIENDATSILSSRTKEVIQQLQKIGIEIPEALNV